MIFNLFSSSKKEIQKHIILIRHAKSHAYTHESRDFERTLNERGHNDAQLMAKRLVAKYKQIDVLISSPAVRTVTTASYFAEAYHIADEHIILKPELYLAHHPVYYHLLKQLDDNIHVVAIVSHNHGITSFADSLTHKEVEHLPTASIFVVGCPIQSWKDLKPRENSYLFFDFPKKEQH